MTLKLHGYLDKENHIQLPRFMERAIKEQYEQKDQKNKQEARPWSSIPETMQHSKHDPGHPYQKQCNIQKFNLLKQEGNFSLISPWPISTASSSSNTPLLSATTQLPISQNRKPNNKWKYFEETLSPTLTLIKQPQNKCDTKETKEKLILNNQNFNSVFIIEKNHNNEFQRSLFLTTAQK